MTIKNNDIRTRANPDCHVCGARGVPLYQRLQDRLFSVPGEWNLKKCPSPQCGLVWLDPMPIEEDIGKAYLSYYTHKPIKSELVTYGKGGVFIRKVFRFIRNGYLATRYNYKNGVSFIQQISGYGLYALPSLVKSLNIGVRYIKYIPNGKLLDIGCGDGGYLQHMCSLGWEVEGVDFDPEAVINARSKGLAVQFGDLAQQRYQDNTFDVITVNHVIEHVSEPQGLLQECRRILKLGGKLVVVTPNVASWGHHHYKADWRGLEPPRHIHIFTLTSLATLFEHAGLSVTKSRTQAGSSKLFLASQSIRMSDKIRFTNHYPLPTRVIAKGMEIYEGLLNIVKKNSGQELVLIGSKEKEI